MYAITLDIVSLLTNIACATRLPIYLTCQPTLRAEVFAIFKLITGEMHTSNKAGRANGDKQSLICANNAVNRAAMQPGWNISDGNGQFIKDVPKFGSVDGRTPVFLTVHQNENGETNNNMTPRIVFEESTETLL
uniref:Piwi domain-containing protein n=1 Tax=Steinernema glaseri TaxID=37863 RepID=A0A1I7ZQ66_9BILA